MKTKNYTLFLLCGIAGLSMATAGVSSKTIAEFQVTHDPFAISSLKERPQPNFDMMQESALLASQLLSGRDLKNNLPDVKRETIQIPDSLQFGMFSVVLDRVSNEKPTIGSILLEQTDNFSVRSSTPTQSLKERIESGELNVSSMNKLLEKTQELAAYAIGADLTSKMIQGLTEKQNTLDIALHNASKFMVRGLKGQIDYIKREFVAALGTSLRTSHLLQQIEGIQSLADANQVGGHITVLIRNKIKALETGHYDVDFARRLYVDDAQKVFGKLGYTVENALFSNGAFAGLVLFKAATEETIIVFADGPQSVGQKRTFGDIGNANNGLEGNDAHFKAFSSFYTDLKDTLRDISARTGKEVTNAFCLGGTGTGAALALQTAANIGNGATVKVTEMPEVYTEQSAAEVRRTLGSGNVIATSNKNTNLGWALGLTVIADQAEAPQKASQQALETPAPAVEAAKPQASFWGKVGAALNPRNWW